MHSIEALEPKLMDPFTIFSLISYSIIFLTVTISFWGLLNFTTSKNLPPGPPKLPILGNIHQLKGAAPHRVLRTLARKYGPIMYLQLGQVPTVVISTPRLAQEILKTNDAVFADRPTTIASQILFYKAQDIAVRSYNFIRDEEVARIWKKAKWLKRQKQLDDILEDILEEHRNNRSSGGHDQEDLVDVLLRIKGNGDLDQPITYDNVKGIILDMIIGGTDASSMTLEWAMAELMRNPEIMKKVQTEVRSVAKGDTVVEDDIQNMHYMKMVVKETFRLHGPPILVPRQSREPCTVDGYHIPVKTRILVNAWACGTDPDSWEDADSFIPERFEMSSINYLGSDFQLLPFGGGRRICPGISFGVGIIENALANLLFHFDWELPNGLKPHELDMTEATVLSNLPKHPLEAVPVVMQSLQK
ncbi:hypothetical protein E3N88_11848 [Mikania micrantha]|uniref:Cytochrome P450 n=1 Tax=Mikania micrantha TaxID=192012 RepID=A0A5N6P3Z0_9ASTR|nr:hypothetical protein E3N88_11848 [Mikania micrantha]